MALAEIEALTKEHAEDRALLAERVRALQDEIEGLKARRMNGIKAALSHAKDSQLRLQALIGESRADFRTPRTRVFHGIKVGLKKSIGKLKCPKPAELLKLIRKHFADQVDVLIKTEEEPVKAALRNLKPLDLKMIGCSIEGAGDCVVIEPADSELDKLVDALMGKPGRELDDGEDAA